MFFMINALFRFWCIIMHNIARGMSHEAGAYSLQYDTTNAFLSLTSNVLPIVETRLPLHILGLADPKRACKCDSVQLFVLVSADRSPKMPKTSVPTRVKLTTFVKSFGPNVLSTDGAVLFCKVCDKNISADKKFLVTQHLDGVKHKAAEAKKSSASATSSTTLLQPYLQVSGKQSQFSRDLCDALISSGIPLHKLEKESFRKFLEKYTKMEVPAEATLRKGYVDILYREKIDYIRERVGDKSIWISVDETTDATGRYIANAVIGTMEPTGESQMFLLNCEQLEKTNSTTIAQFFSKSLAVLWPESIKHDRVLLFVTDAAAYMKKAARALKVLFPNMWHVTCLVHALHRVAEEIRHLFPDVDLLVANGKKIFLKAPSRVVLFHDIAPGIPLPPQPILTRWGTWLSAAIYYAVNYDKFGAVVEAFDEDDSASIKTVKRLLEKQAVRADLAYILSNFTDLPVAMQQLETRNLPLIESLRIVDSVVSSFERAPGSRGLVVQQKMDRVLAANEDLEHLRKMAQVLAGEKTDIDPSFSPSQISAFKYAPVTSVDVERSFSALTHVLSDRRRSLTTENLKKLLIVACN
jgi:hypothetical protein